MTWYDPTTDLVFTIGEEPPKTKWDKIGADLLALYKQENAVGGEVQFTQTISPADNAMRIYSPVGNAVAWNRRALASTAQAMLLVPAGAGGVYHLELEVRSETLGNLLCYLMLNDATILGGGSANAANVGDQTGQSARAARAWPLAVGDTIKAAASHAAGGAASFYLWGYRISA